jgi:hypothetical protein
MKVREQIRDHLAAQPEPKRSDMERLHGLVLESLPGCRLWFLDGRDERGRVVSNPSIGYGVRTIRYADGTSREFYQVGISANTSGLSVYIMGLEDRRHLAQTYGKRLGKASVTGYCIKFRKLGDIDLDTLVAAIRDGVGQTRA